MSPSSQQKQRKPEEVKAIKYRGRLNAAQAAAGINAALRNAKRLLTDATLLFQSGSYATAAALAVLAIEENGKYGIIPRILLAKNDRQRNEHWKEYTSHEAKNTTSIIPSLVRGGATSVDDFKIMTDANSIHPYVLDDFKHWGFYTECRTGDNWSEPHNSIEAETAFKLLQTAHSLIRNVREVTDEQMAVYVKHMSPVWADDHRNADPEKVRNALKVYMIECQQRGWMENDANVEDFFRANKSPQSTPVNKE